MKPAPSPLQRAAFVAAWVAVLCVPGARAQDLAVSAVRFWSLGEITRVAVETTGEFHHRFDRLANPDRIFFDFPGAANRVSRKSLFLIPVGDPILRQIRVAETTPGNTRVVLDLEDPGIQFTASHLSNPDRLVIELRRGGTPPEQPTAEAEIRSVSEAPAVARPRSPTKKFTPPPRAATPSPVLIPPPPGQRSARYRAGESEPALLTRRLAAMSATPPPRGLAPAASSPSESAAPPAPRHAPAKPEAPPPTAARLPAPAKRPESGTNTLTRALGLKVSHVVLDPGHGGHDTGTIGPAGLLEKDLVLDVAKRLSPLIEKGLGSQVTLTRADDSFVPLEARTEIANRSKADLFLSIHANSSPVRGVTGSETYYLSFTTSRAALDLAARENANSERSVFELRELIRKIALKEKVEESREFAVKVQTAMQAVNPRGARAKDRGIKKAPFVVLIGASMPSVLTEIGFVSNAREETLLKQPDHRQKIAEALYKAVSRYAMTLSHFEVAHRGEGGE